MCSRHADLLFKNILRWFRIRANNPRLHAKVIEIIVKFQIYDLVWHPSSWHLADEKRPQYNKVLSPPSTPPHFQEPCVFQQYLYIDELDILTPWKIEIKTNFKCFYWVTYVSHSSDSSMLKKDIENCKNFMSGDSGLVSCIHNGKKSILSTSAFDRLSEVPISLSPPMGDNLMSHISNPLRHFRLALPETKHFLRWGLF